MTIAERIEALQADERAIVEKLLDRIEQGREVYGPWKVDDGRDYQSEALAEVIDALHYCAAVLVKAGGWRPETGGKEKKQHSCCGCSTCSLKSPVSSLAPKVPQ